MLSEEALVKAVKRALLSQSDDGMVKELLVIHERERLSQRFEAINKIQGKSATDLMEDDVSSRHDLVKRSWPLRSAPLVSLCQNHLAEVLLEKLTIEAISPNR